MLRAGLDISADAVRVCVVKMGEEPLWRASAIEELPAGAVVDGAVREDVVVVAAIQRAMEELEADAITVGYRGDQALTTSFTLPRMSSAELAEQIEWEAEQHLPFDASESAIEYRVTADDPGTGQMTVRLTAMRNALVDGIVALTKQAGVETRAIDPVEDALLRAARLGPPTAGDHAIVAAMADVNLTVVSRAGELAYARAGEIQRALDFGSAAHEVDVVGVTVLGPRAKAVTASLRDELDVPVAVWSPPHTGLKPVSAEFGVALGLALPGPPMTRVGDSTRRRGLWARLFG